MSTSVVTFRSRKGGEPPLTMVTCYDTTLWPVSVGSASWTTPDRLQPALRSSDTPYALRLELNSAPDVLLPQLGMDRLRLHLFGENTLVHPLYELLCSKLVRIVVRDLTPRSKVAPVTLPASCLRPVGFKEDEGMWPYPRRSFIGYRIIQEFFAMPNKFLFLDLTGLADVWAHGFQQNAELIFLFSTAGDDDRRQRLETGVSSKVFRLGCSPIINLFPQTAEPILLDQKKYEYPVRPDLRRQNAIEVFSVDEVKATDTATRQTVHYRPFYSYQYMAPGKQQDCFWIASRRDSEQFNKDGSDVYISLVDRSMRAVLPAIDTLTIHTTCSNRDLPARLPFGTDEGSFELEGNAPIKRIVALTKPTAPLRPPKSKLALWHLISHLSLNHLSMVEDGREALQQILRLYDLTDSSSQTMVNGITGLKSRPHFGRVLSENGIVFARGTKVELELDDEQFVGGGIFLFASVIEQFLALYTSLNSFTQLVATHRRGKEVLHEWPPRAGQRILV